MRWRTLTKSWSTGITSRWPRLARRNRRRRRRSSADRSMRFAVVLPWWGYALAFGAAIVLGWIAYARVPVRLRTGQRIGLSALRAAALIFLIAILLRPVVMVPPAAANNS